MRCNAGWYGKLLEEWQEPVTARIAGEAGDLRKIERQIVGEQTMPELGLGLRDDLVRVSLIPGQDFGKSRTEISVIPGQRFR